MTFSTLTPADLALLLEGIDELDVGISVFDGDLKLIAANRHFCRMLDFPEALCRPGSRLEDFFRHNAARGEYGPGEVDELVRQRIALARQFVAHCFERTRPDGTVLEVRGRPLASGGMATIYTDVTVQRHREQALKELSEELERRVEERTAELQRREAELARKTALLEQVMGNVCQGVTLFNSELKLELCNAQFLEIMRFPAEFGAPGTPFEAFMRYNAERGEFRPGEAEERFRAWVDMAEKRLPYRFERTRPDGSSIEVMGNPTPDGGFVSTYLDISDRKRAEAALQDSEAQLRAILEASPVGVALISSADRIVRFCNQRLAQLLGQTTEALIGQPPGAGCEKVLGAWTPGSAGVDTEAALTRADGSEWWGLISIRTIPFQGRDAMLVWAYDATELHLARQQLEHLAHHDPLTGIPNRRQFEQAARQALAHAQRFSGHGALLFIDLDGFKAVNDHYGHHTGDALLQVLAAQLSKRLRRSDFIARLGGDEFAIIVQEPEAVGNIDAFAREIIAIISSAARGVAPDCEVSASVGIARFDALGPDISTLMRHADDAMYRAKAAGKATVRYENTDE